MGESIITMADDGGGGGGGTVYAGEAGTPHPSLSFCS